ncbi:MAG: hypothetical protein A2868_04210 [Candidatus Levybacteria bacterium RIFCSPHIGHO2_01_FULL_40_15b]|nr:MAG: hypothetical protein A2868_04210 [Candidatus Levybacteria bacterium RIFCSPHIGHO2_01_FULL_40_15b]
MSELNNSQLKQLAEFLSNLALLFFAGSIITPLFTEFNRPDPFTIVSGFISTLAFLTASMIILRGVKKDD